MNKSSVKNLEPASHLLTLEMQNIRLDWGTGKNGVDFRDFFRTCFFEFRGQFWSQNGGQHGAKMFTLGIQNLITNRCVFLCLAVEILVK